MMPDNIATYQNSLAAVKQLQKEFNTAMQATGDFSVYTVKATDSTTKFSKAIADNKVNIGQVITNLKQFKTELADATAKQVAFQKATAMQWTENGTGHNMIDLYVPKGVTADMADLQTKYGMINNWIGKIGTGTLNWGKNMQWAGRQITAGLSMPIGIAAAGLATMAINTDTELTKITKMYSTQAEANKNNLDATQMQLAKEQELSNVRTQSMQNAIELAKKYGVAINETLAVEANMASKGFTGNSLMQMTNETMRASMIGGISTDDATNMIMSMSSAYSIKPAGMGDAVNYLNALKNNTNLTLQDISTAIPKIGATIANLVPPTKGANAALEESGTLLSAFAQGGVQATQGANALKTALARGFAPTKATIQEFKSLTSAVKEFAGANGQGIDLAKIKKSSGGDPVQFFQDLGKAMAGMDPVSMNTALKDLFGIQQSNRMMTVLKSLMTADPNNPTTQTGKAMQLAQQGPGTWSDIANQEIEQFQQSASGKFKIAVATMKAELSQLGQPIMNFFTPVIGFITNIISKLNSMPGFFKSAFGFLAGGAVIAGPLIMLTGLFGNLFGNAMKFGSTIGNLFLKFKPLDAEEAANAAIARLSTDATDKQAQATALLADKMGQLNVIMKENIDVIKEMILGAEGAMSATDDMAKSQANASAIADGLASAEKGVASAEDSAASAAAANAEANATGLWGKVSSVTPTGAPQTPFTFANGAIRGPGGRMMSQEQYRSYNSLWSEAAPANAAANSAALWGQAGQKVDETGMKSFAEDAAKAEEEMTTSEAASESIAANSEKTSMNFGKIAGAAAGLGIGVMAVQNMAQGSGSILTNVMNATMAFAGFGMAFSALKDVFSGIATMVKGLFAGEALAGVSKFSAAVAKIGSILGTVVETVTSAARWLFLTGPGIFLSVLTAAAITLYTIYEDETKLTRAQDQINKSTESWASILGYTETKMKNFNTSTSAGVAATQARQVAVNKLTDANSALVDSLKSAAHAQDNFDSVYKAASKQAAEVVISGGSVDQAKQAFQIALQAAGLKQYQIKQLSVRFDSVDLTNSDVLAGIMVDDINSALARQEARKGGDIGAGFWRSMMTQSNIRDQAAAAASDIGNSLYLAFEAEQSSSDGQVKIAQNFTDSLNKAFASQFQNMKSKNAALFNRMGIDTMAQLYSAVSDAQNAAKGKLTQNQSQLLDAVFGKMDKGRGAQFDGGRLGSSITNEFKQYQEYWNGVVTSVGKAMGKTGKDLDGFVNNTKTVNQLLTSIGGTNATKTVAEATDAYNKALQDYKNSHAGKDMPQDMKLIELNAMRASAGLGRASSVTEGFTQTAQEAAQAAADAAPKIASMAEAMNVDPSEMVTNQQQIVKAIQDGYGGGIKAATSQAQQLWSQAEQDSNTAIQNSSKKREDALTLAQKKQDQYYSDQLKAASQAAAAQNKQISQYYADQGKMYDAQIKQAQDAAKAQTDGIQEQIKALQKQDTVRQQLFQNEQNRIQRMAQMYSGNIDFNEALNSGNLDSAAKIRANNESQVQQWGLSDQQQAMDNASKAQQDALQTQIDNINAAKDAQVAAIQVQKDALSGLEQAAQDAAQAQQQAVQDSINAQKQAYDDAKQAAITADQEKTQSALQSNQRMWADKKTKLDQEIAAITASVPATMDQYNKQISDIEAAYKNYGVDLQGYGDEWSGIIGNGLTQSIQQAANALQSDIGWQQVGTYIQQQIDSAGGVSIDQITHYLQTGQWESNPNPNKAQPWHPPAPGEQSRGFGGNHVREMWTGGYGDGPGFTGMGRKFDIAGIVHKGEFVFPQNAVNRLGVNFLGSLAGLPGYDAGGLVTGMGLSLLTNAMVTRALFEESVAKTAIAQASAAHQNGRYGAAFAGSVAGGVERWRSVVDQALAMLGLPKNADSGVLNIIQHESGGNPGAINLWDSNARAGHPSQGLMQTIPSTFFAWAGPLAGRGILDPLANVYAGINYANHRYGLGMLMAGGRRGANGQYLGYDNGGFLPPVGVNYTGKPEPVFTDGQWAIMKSLINASTQTLSSATAGKIASESGNTYNINMEINGVSNQVDFEKGVENALYSLDARYGRSRSISS